MRPYEFHIDRLPSEYIHERCYFSTQPLGHTVGDPELLASAIKLANPGSIMYASDLPHTDFDPPEELFNRIKSFFDPDEVRGMMGETALDVYDISV
jgi:predicted TIM-barrel fold metal-dependent hydrolase